MNKNGSGDLDPIHRSDSRIVQTIEGNSVPAGPGAHSVTAAARGIPYWQLFWGHRLFIAAFILLGTIIGFAYVVYEKPVYPAASIVELLPVNQGFMNMSLVDPEAGTDVVSASVTNIQTQLKILTSRSNITHVVERINLEGPLTVTPPTTIFTRLRQRIPLLQREPITQNREAMGVAAHTISARGVGATRLIEIRCESTSPEIAAQFANTLAAEYITQTASSHSNVSQHTSQWIESQLEEAKSKLEDSGEKLREFVQKSGMDFFPEQTTLADSQMKLLQTNTSVAQADRITKQARWELARGTPLEDLPDVLADGSLQVLKSKLNDLRREMAQLTATLTPEHYKVQRVQAQITETQESLEKEEKATLERTRSDYEEALNHEKLLLGAYRSQTHTVSAQADKAAQYAMLKRDVEMDQGLYNNLLQHSSQAALIALAPTSNIRVIDPATPIRVPSNPRPSRDIPASALTFGGLGYGLLVLRETARRKRYTRLFESPGHTTPFLNVPELGVIPSAQMVRSKKRFNPVLTLTNGVSEEQNGKAGMSPSVLLPANKSSLLAESFRQTLVSILRTRPKNHNPIYVLTSAGPGEGKTTLSVNLATAMAEIGLRVLLVDVDVRRSHMDKFFGSPDHKGLSDLLICTECVDDLDLQVYTHSAHECSRCQSGSNVQWDRQDRHSRADVLLTQSWRVASAKQIRPCFDTALASPFPDACLRATRGWCCADQSSAGYDALCLVSLPTSSLMAFLFWALI